MAKAANGTQRVLLVDDDPDLLHLVSVRLEANGFEIAATDSAETALAKLPQFRPHVVVTDLRMPGMDGMELFQEIQKMDYRLPVIVLTAHGTIPDAVAAAQEGVFAYLVKPVDAKILLDSIRRAITQTGQSQGNGDAEQDQDWRKDIISCSAVMETLLQRTQAAANSDVNILIESETGTGKELLAKAIHSASSRQSEPFLALNCAAIPESLIESELFGHAAGSFTGANKSHDGLFQAADGGTAFLDEIGDMPLSAQAKLLRVLEQREIRPVGSTKTIPVDVRIVAATHQDLEKLVQEGEFREDLYYRLDVIKLELPPLSERREDIPLLAEHFCRIVSEKNNRDVNKFSPEAVELLVGAPWPGNVRQLYNVTEQCVVLTTTPIISRGLVERAMRHKGERLQTLSEAKEQFEHDYLVRILNLAEGNIALASRLADRNRSEFYNLLKKHSLEPDQFRRNSDD